jgi:hypothetical protein
MEKRRNLWSRIKALLHPVPETYETRKPRPGDPGPGLGGQVGPTDQRRDGGSMAIGG